MINWKKYFDRIIVLHYPKYPERMTFLSNELDRVGILNSGILDIHENISSPFLDTLIKTVNCDKRLDAKTISCAWGHYSICKIIELHGYERTLILEDDITFHKDVCYILNTLENMPSDQDITLLSHFCSFVIKEDLQLYFDQIAEHRRMNSLFIPLDGHSPNIGSAGTYVLSKNGAIVLRGLYERYVQYADTVFQQTRTYGQGDKDKFDEFVLSKLNKYYTTNIISIQNLNYDSMSSAMFGDKFQRIKEINKDIYSKIGIDVMDYIR